MQDEKEQKDRPAGTTEKGTAQTDEKGTRKTGLGTPNVVENPDRPDEC
jgi:hypothetical protein